MTCLLEALKPKLLLVVGHAVKSCKQIAYWVILLCTGLSLVCQVSLSRDLNP